MSETTDSIPQFSIKQYLHHCRLEAINRIVERARNELPDYRARNLQELRLAVGKAYDNWCLTVLNNDFSISQVQSRRAIQENLEQGRDPAQIAATPRLICEETLKLLEEAGPLVDTQERLRFCRIGTRLTDLMVKTGQLLLASAAGDKAFSINKGR